MTACGCQNWPVPATYRSGPHLFLDQAIAWTGHVPYPCSLCRFIVRTAIVPIPIVYVAISLLYIERTGRGAKDPYGSFAHSLAALDSTMGGQQRRMVVERASAGFYWWNYKPCRHPMLAFARAKRPRSSFQPRVVHCLSHSKDSYWYSVCTIRPLCTCNSKQAVLLVGRLRRCQPCPPYRPLRNLYLLQTTLDHAGLV